VDMDVTDEDTVAKVFRVKPTRKMEGDFDEEGMEHVLTPKMKYFVELMILLLTRQMSSFDRLQSANGFRPITYILRHTAFSTKDKGEIIRSCNWSARRETRLKCIEDYFLMS